MSINLNSITEVYNSTLCDYGIKVPKGETSFAETQLSDIKALSNLTEDQQKNLFECFDNFIRIKIFNSQLRANYAELTNDKKKEIIDNIFVSAVDHIKYIVENCDSDFNKRKAVNARGKTISLSELDPYTEYRGATFYANFNQQFSLETNSFDNCPFRDDFQLFLKPGMKLKSSNFSGKVSLVLSNKFITDWSFTGDLKDILEKVKPSVIEIINPQFNNENFKNLLNLSDDFKQSVTELKITNAKLSDISGIGQLSNLATLNLNSNQLTELPKEISQLSNLVKLNLDSNQLTELPKEIGQLSNLVKLDLDLNQLRELPKEIGNLSNLVTLNLFNSCLTELPKEIGSLSNLTTLNLEYSRLAEIPKEIGQLSNLATLNLQENFLTELPKEIGELSKLRELGLCGNQLTALPKEICQLSNLAVLNLSFNQLTELPKDIQDFLETIKSYSIDLQGL